MDSDSLFSHSCRICSIELKNGVFVFGEEGKQMYLQAKVRKYLYITISFDDRLPKMICESCCKKLDGIHKFATMAVKMQDRFNKLATHDLDDGVGTKKIVEAKGLLHTYLTKGVKENDRQQDSEITEMEVKVDPMLILQCSFYEDDSSETLTDPESMSLEKFRPRNDDHNDKSHDCEMCKKKFKTETDLQAHTAGHLTQNRILKNNHKNIKVEEIDDDTKLLKNIEQRPVSTTSSSEGESTENTNLLRYTCPICSKMISTKGNLKVHLETHRPKGKYGCDSCGRIFKTQCNLHRHKEYHEGVQFPCGVCGRVYPTNSTLRAHSITHSDLRPHKCPLCDKTFKRNQDLKFHINQHTGARPYRCPYCPKAFASSGNCFSHRKRMHPLEVERDRERAAKIMR